MLSRTKGFLKRSTIFSGFSFSGTLVRFSVKIDKFGLLKRASFLFFQTYFIKIFNSIGAGLIWLSMIGGDFNRFQPLQ